MVKKFKGFLFCSMLLFSVVGADAKQQTKVTKQAQHTVTTTKVKKGYQVIDNKTGEKTLVSSWDEAVVAAFFILLGCSASCMKQDSNGELVITW